MAVNEAPRLQYDREYEEAIMARPRPLEYSVDEWQTMAEGESKRYLELLKKMRFGDLMMTLIYLDYPEKDVLRAFADPNGSFFYELNGEVDDSSFYNTDHVYHPIRIRRIQNVVQLCIVFEPKCPGCDALCKARSYAADMMFEMYEDEEDGCLGEPYETTHSLFLQSHESEMLAKRFLASHIAEKA